MTTSLKIGKKFEEETRKYLINQNYLVERKPHVRLKNVSKDFFNLFDILAINPQKIRFIQCKVNSVKVDDYHKIRDFIENECPFGTLGEIWLYEKEFDIVLVNEYYKNEYDKVLSRRFEIKDWSKRKG